MVLGVKGSRDAVFDVFKILLIQSLENGYCQLWAEQPHKCNRTIFKLLTPETTLARYTMTDRDKYFTQPRGGLIVSRENEMKLDIL